MTEDKDLSKRKIYAQGSGSWLSHIEFNGELFWQIDQEFPEWQLPEKLDDPEFLLPSDSSKRLDIISMKIQDFDSAEK